MTYGPLKGVPIEELIGEIADVSPIDPSDADYVEERRRLLGPSADISHPEFGLRPNRPDETFRLVTEITHPSGDLTNTDVVSVVLDASGAVIEIATYQSKKTEVDLSDRNITLHH